MLLEYSVTEATLLGASRGCWRLACFSIGRNARVSLVALVGMLFSLK